VNHAGGSGDGATPDPRASIPAGRVAAIDYGRRRMGIAICDAERIIASPLPMREPGADPAAEAAFFRALVAREEVVGFVVGLPLHADGTESDMSREARRFGAWLAATTGLPVVWQDERYTSSEAAGRLAGLGLSRGKKKARSDSIAAQIILSGWMESTPRPTSPRARRRRRLVVGCGYLGGVVAARWVAAGDAVWGIVRTPSRQAALEAAGVTALVADVAGAAPLPALPEVDTVVWSVGFDRSAGQAYRDVHVTGLARLLDALSGSPRVVMVGSTGVWGRVEGMVVDESTPPSPEREAGRVLLDAERVLADHRLGPGTVLRLAGIYGPGRLPRLDDLRAGRPLPADPDSWLNLIHVDDAATILMAVAGHPSPGPLYVVSDGHPLRRGDFYATLADLCGSPPPQWTPPPPESRGGDKRVDPGRLFREIAPTLAHPRALEALAGILKGGGGAAVAPPGEPSR